MNAHKDPKELDLLMQLQRDLDGDLVKYPKWLGGQSPKVVQLQIHLLPGSLVQSRHELLNQSQQDLRLHRLRKLHQLSHRRYKSW